MLTLGTHRLFGVMYCIAWEITQQCIHNDWIIALFIWNICFSPRFAKGNHQVTTQTHPQNLCWMQFGKHNSTSCFHYMSYFNVTGYTWRQNMCSTILRVDICLITTLYSIIWSISADKIAKKMYILNQIQLTTCFTMAVQD